MKTPPRTPEPTAAVFGMRVYTATREMKPAGMERRGRSTKKCSIGEME